MTRRSVQVLAAAVVGLLLLFVVTQRSDRFETLPADVLLLPDFRSNANAVRRVEIRRPGDEPADAIVQTDGEWSVSARDGYKADFGKLSKLIIALAEARILEEKTSNPERYAALGVDDPLEGGGGTRLTVAGDDFSYAVILGDAARGDFRYVRLADANTSYLVDQALAIPEETTGWLNPGIVDIGSQRVRRVSISHADGECIVIEKDSEEATDFSVLDVPEGRELSYESVGNSVGGALDALELEDVRKAVDAQADTTTVFETWDGLTITVAILSAEDSSWLSFAASAAADMSDNADVVSINERVSGWQFRITDFKKNALTRRWEDMLREKE